MSYWYHLEPERRVQQGRERLVKEFELPEFDFPVPLNR